MYINALKANRTICLDNENLLTPVVTIHEDSN